MSKRAAREQQSKHNVSTRVGKVRLTEEIIADWRQKKKKKKKGEKSKSGGRGEVMYQRGKCEVQEWKRKDADKHLLSWTNADMSHTETGITVILQISNIIGFI